MEQLYNLRPNGVCDFLTSLESALRFVNLNRMQSGIDNYGYGRLPHCPEQVKFPAYFSTIGSEMTVAPYRWDHRLFSIVLRFPGHYPNNSAQLMVTPPSTDDSIIQTMCAATGGRSFSIYLHKSLGYCIDTILQRIQYTGVLMRLEKRGPDPPPPKQQPPPNENGNGELPNGTSPGQNPAPSSSTIGDAWKSQVVSLLMNTRKHQGAGHWPIPESYWPDTKMLVLFFVVLLVMLHFRTNLPPRDVHPLLCFRCEPHEPMILQNFPFDKYELENCALSQFMVERKEQDVCWQVFAENSSRSGDLGHPFGYLKLSSNMQSVTLFIMPYNYPMLLPLLDGPIKDPKLIESSSFRQKFDKYLATIPPYYYSKPIVENRYTQAISQPLKKALAKIKIAIPALEDFTTQIYNSHIVTLITKMKYHGKELFEKTCIEVARNLEMYPPVLYNAPQFVRATHCRLINSKKDKQDSQLPVAYQQYKTEIPQMFKDVNVCISESPMATIMPSMKFKNPFDIDRRNLLSQLEKMKINFDQQVDFKSLHVLEGGKPGQKIKLQHAGK
ncbi:integrator complex subunit 6-A [Ditylenchus destructor]|nr:integrator complex subunit 6-A [Ditylenchus destructor]